MQAHTATKPRLPRGVPAVSTMPSPTLEALCRRLPPFPPLANQLIDLFSSPDACLHQAETLIRSDAVFSGELLRLANSAEFAAREPFEEVAPAVVYLGFERVRTVIRRVTYARLMKDHAQHPFTPEIHRANLATAFLCEKLYKGYGDDEYMEGFCPYSLGLYLKIGATALLRAHPKDYPRFLCARLPATKELLADEAQRFGFHHIRVSAFLVRQWGFPDSFASLVARHGNDAEITLPLSAQAAASLAWRMAGSLGYTFLKGYTFESFDSLQALLSGESRTMLPASADEWKQGIEEHLEALKISKA